MAAEVLAAGGVAVTVYERMPSVGRKFLLAGRGGLNLTHSEAIERFLSRYGTARPHLRAAIEAFTPDMLRHLASQVGASQLVIGTDHPIPWHEDPVTHIMETPGFSDEERIAMLGGTAAKLLGIKP